MLILYMVAYRNPRGNMGHQDGYIKERVGTTEISIWDTMWQMKISFLFAKVGILPYYIHRYA